MANATEGFAVVGAGLSRFGNRVLVFEQIQRSGPKSRLVTLPAPESHTLKVSDLIRDLAIHTQLAALTIGIFYSDALATLLEIVGFLLIYFFCHVRDLETPKRSQVRPAHAKQPIPNTVIETTVDHEIDIHGGTGQFEAERFRGYVADSLMQELPNSQSASSGYEAIVKKLDLIIAGLEMLADAFKDANHKSVINKEELYAQVMQIDGIDPDLKLRMFDYTVGHDIGKAFLAVPHGERKDWLLMKIIDAKWALIRCELLYRMTYCRQHPSRKMLLMLVEPFERNKSCYVYCETPLSLHVNTHRSTLRVFVKKIVKGNLGMDFPLLMHGSALLYEVGDDLEEDMAANYAANLHKDSYLIFVVPSVLPSPVSSGTVPTVEDLQQELSCNVNIMHTGPLALDGIQSTIAWWIAGCGHADFSSENFSITIRMITTLWAIWKARNDRLGGKTFPPPLRLPGNRSTTWMVPPINYVKINVDGAWDPLNNKARAGIIIRDHLGVTIFRQSFPTDSVSARVSETKAIFLDLYIALSQGWSNFILEGDANQLFDYINNKECNVHWDISTILKDIKVLWNQIPSTLVQAIPRSANGAACNLAKRALMWRKNGIAAE
ncbi:hypothetical protein HHK36_008623 [Tetracentron sinense]|uniref:RNase H type-1 domain-containing protein n=1 Tax=Tetracentron sinense TaxID=13715 RepID=A0A834ZFV4_TETSI|nr:hypothetical protein HHK36_008623 [Tetracentron sinense]